MRLQTVTHDDVINGNAGEKVFIRVRNDQGDVLEPSYACVYSASTSLTEPGLKVALPSVAINLTTGLGAKVAGVTTATISTGDLGFLQVFGPANVRTSASLAAGVHVVTHSANATNIGSVSAISASTAVAASYYDAAVGWTVAHVNATNATVQLTLM